MRIGISTLCAVACAAILVSCSGGCPDDPGVYCDRVNGFRITFPEDWTVETDPGEGLAVSASAPLDEGTDPEVTGTSFEVMVVSLQSDPDLETFFGDYVKRLPEGKPYYQHYDSGEIKVDGRKTKYILYAVDTEPRIEARLEYLQKKGKKIYVFRGVTRGIQFNGLHDQFREIAYTFQTM